MTLVIVTISYLCCQVVAGEKSEKIFIGFELCSYCLVKCSVVAIRTPFGFIFVLVLTALLKIKYNTLSLLSLPNRSGSSLKRADYLKQICLADPLSFECFQCS